MDAMTMLLWPLLIARLVFTTAEVQRKSLSPLPVLELESKGEQTQTINTAPITIHIPLPKSHSKHETPDAPAAIASEAPEGTYLLPLTEQRKPVSPPAINLVVNLRLLMDGEGTELVKFRHQILFAHNSKRLLHRVPPLTEDQKLNTEAQSFAFKLARQGNITHSPLEDRLGKGENVALRCSLKVSPLTGTRATNLWYDESKKFNWNAKSVTPATERFTQMVWKSTSKVGFGRAQFKDKAGRTCFVVVARYEPAGNEKATLMDNVFQPSQQGSRLSQKFDPKIKS